MQKLSGKIANLFAVGVLIGSSPLLFVCIIVSNYIMAKKAGEPFNGDAIGLAMLAGLSYVLALVSFFAGLIYFCSMRTLKKRSPQRWHLLALAWVAMLICVPMLYLTTV